MKPPLTNEQEILYTLIKKGFISMFDYPVMAGYRTRLSNLKLKHGLEFETIKATRCNKFSRPYVYHVHKLKDLEKAKELYKNLTVNN